MESDYQRTTGAGGYEMKRDSGYLAVYGAAVKQAQHLSDSTLEIELCAMASVNASGAKYDAFEDTMMDRLAAIHGDHGIPDHFITWTDPENVERGYPHA
jgi:hypothetical protein